MQHKRLSHKTRKDAVYVWFGFILIILGKTLTNGQSSCPDLFIKAPFLIIWFSCECSYGGRGEKKENSGVRGYRKLKVQLLQIKRRLQRQKKPQPKPNLNTWNWHHKQALSWLVLWQSECPQKTVPKSLENRCTIKVNTHSKRKLQVTILNCKWRKFNVERSDKITIWKLLGLLFFSLIDCNAILVFCCTSKPTNQ